MSFFNDFASEMVYPLLPAFITGGLGGGAAMLGALDGAADLTSAVLRWFSGRLADRPGWRKPLIMVGYLTAVAVRPVISFASAAWQVVGFRVVDRVGKGLRSPARDAMISAVTPVEARGRSYGFHRAADHGGAVAGSLIAWLLLRQEMDVRQVIEWSVVPGIVALVVLAWVLRTVRPSAPPLAQPAPPTVPDSGDATGGQFWWPVAALTSLTVLRLPEALLLLFLLDSGVGIATVPLVWAGLHVVRTGAAYPGGILADRVGSRTTLRVGSLLYAALVATLAIQGNPAAAAGVFLALGLVSGMIEPAERALVAGLAPIRTGRGFGTVQAIGGIVALPAGLAFGAVYQWQGAATALLASAALVALIAVAWRPAPTA
ncbi:MAG: MFS transporter [Gemmatimonadota bacterium]|nr:MFS transporter [Gemmatimonadota bacterium]